MAAILKKQKSPFFRLSAPHQIIVVHYSRQTVELSMQELSSRIDRPKNIYLKRVAFWVPCIKKGRFLFQVANQPASAGSIRYGLRQRIGEVLLEKHAAMTRTPKIQQHHYSSIFFFQLPRLAFSDGCSQKDFTDPLSQIISNPIAT